MPNDATRTTTLIALSLRQRREALEFSLAELSSVVKAQTGVDVSREQIRRIEKGTSDGTATKVLALARTLGISLDYLAQLANGEWIDMPSTGPMDDLSSAYEEAKLYFVKGEYQEAFERFHRTRQALAEYPDSQQKPAWLGVKLAIALASTAYHLQRPEMAQGLLAEALSHADLPAELRAQALEVWAIVLAALGQHLSAETAGKAAVEESRKVDDLYRQGVAQRNLGNIYWYQARYGEAARCYAAASCSLEIVGETALQVQSRAAEGACLVRLRLSAKGMEMMNGALRRARRCDSPLVSAFCKHMMADSLLYLAKEPGTRSALRTSYARRAEKMYEGCYLLYDQLESWDLMLAAGWQLFLMRKENPRRASSAANYLAMLRKLSALVNPCGLAAAEYRALMEHLERGGDA